MASSVVLLGNYGPVPKNWGNLGGPVTGYSGMARNPYFASDFVQSTFAQRMGRPLAAANSNFAPYINRYGRFGPELDMFARAFGSYAMAAIAIEAELALNQLAWRWITETPSPKAGVKTDARYMMRSGFRIGPSGLPEVFSTIRTSATKPAYTEASELVVAKENRSWQGLVPLSGIWVSHFPFERVAGNGLQWLRWRFDVPPAGQPANIPVSQPLDALMVKQTPWRDTDKARRSRLDVELSPMGYPFTVDVSARSASASVISNRPPPRGVREDKMSSRKLINALSVVEAGGDLMELLHAYYQAAVETAKDNGDAWKSWSRASWWERMKMIEYGIANGFDPKTLNTGILTWGLGEMAGRYIKSYDGFRYWSIDNLTPRLTIA